jgi:hypothetical protein
MVSTSEEFAAHPRADLRAPILQILEIQANFLPPFQQTSTLSNKNVVPPALTEAQETGAVNVSRHRP